MERESLDLALDSPLNWLKIETVELIVPSIALLTTTTFKVKKKQQISLKTRTFTLKSLWLTP